MQRACFGLLGAIILAAGCGANPPPAAEEPKADTAGDEGGRRHAAPAIESEIGALNQEKVTQTFQHASPRLSACFSKSTQKLAYLAGEVRFVVRVAKDGSARWAYVKESTLGDREAEACMLDALKASAWPKPEGGEGLAENSFTFDPPGDERPPVSWTPEQLGAAYKKAKGTLAQCKKSAGTKAMTATLYVETDGKPASVGVASADEKGEAGVDCVVSALKGLKFPSPGSYAAKVSFTID